MVYRQFKAALAVVQSASEDLSQSQRGIHHSSILQTCRPSVTKQHTYYINKPLQYRYSWAPSKLNAAIMLNEL